jgi:hypothetical protein
MDIASPHKSAEAAAWDPFIHPDRGPLSPFLAPPNTRWIILFPMYIMSCIMYNLAPCACLSTHHFQRGRRNPLDVQPNDMRECTGFCNSMLILWLVWKYITLSEFPYSHCHVAVGVNRVSYLSFINEIWGSRYPTLKLRPDIFKKTWFNYEMTNIRSYWLDRSVTFASDTSLRQSRKRNSRLRPWTQM